VANNNSQAKAENKKIINDVTIWLETQIEKNQFCDLSVTLSNHAGKISKCQKSLTQKFQ
jgi:hypothetical protein